MQCQARSIYRQARSSLARNYSFKDLLAAMSPWSISAGKMFLAGYEAAHIARMRNRL